MEKLSQVERWLPVVGYEGLYEISDSGRVKSLHDTKGYKPGRIIASRINTFGYRQIMLSKNGKTKQNSVHRLVASAFIINPLNKPQVNHIDSDKSNNNLSNLEWATRKENVIHAIENNLYRKSSFDILEIIRLRKSGLMYKDINSKMGISASHARHLFNRHKKSTTP